MEKVDIMTIIISVIAVIISVFAYIDSSSKNKMDEAIAHGVITYKQEKNNERNVQVSYGFNENEKEEIKEYPMYPVKINVKSGAIAQIYPIVSIFKDNKDPIVTVAGDIQPQLKIKTMNNAKNEIIPGEVPSFWSKGFYQSYLITCTDGTNHLLMMWYNTEKHEQGFIDNIRSISTIDNNGEAPDYIIKQYNELKQYLNKKGIEVM